MRYCKTFPIVIKMLEDLIRKSSFHSFSFSDISLTSFHIFFSLKLVIDIHLSLFIRTIQNNTILSSSNITYWKSDIFFVKVQSTLCRWNTRPLSLNEFENKFNKELPREIIKLETVPEIWKENINKSFSSFDTQFVLRLVLLFYTISVMFIKVFLMQKLKSNTIQTLKKEKQLSIKVLRFPIRREKYIGYKLFLGQFFMGEGATVTRERSEIIQELYRWEIWTVIFFRGTIVRGVIIIEAIFRGNCPGRGWYSFGTIILGGNCLGQPSRGQFFRGQLSSGEIVRWSIFFGGNCIHH